MNHSDYCDMCSRMRITCLHQCINSILPASGWFRILHCSRTLIDLKGQTLKMDILKQGSKQIQSVFLGLVNAEISLSLMFYGEIFSLLISVMKSCFLRVTLKIMVATTYCQRRVLLNHLDYSVTFSYLFSLPRAFIGEASNYE